MTDTLFDALEAAPEFAPVVDRGLTIEEAFEAFHAANPWVYDALVRLARDLSRRGRHVMGIGMLFEVLRWHWYRTTDDPHSEFKLNNNYRSRYARLIMRRERDLDGIFNLRELRAR
jgi:hypothetical protein